jgi:hypothetical protein
MQSFWAFFLVLLCILGCLAYVVSKPIRGENATLALIMEH